MGSLLTASEELSAFRARSSRDFAEAIEGLIRTHVPRFGDYAPRLQALHDLGNVLASTMGLSDLYARKRMLMQVDKRKARYGMNSASYAAPTEESPIVPNHTYQEAVRDIVERDPRLAGDAEEVSRIYNQERGFAMAKSADIVVTKRVQDYISDFLKTGQGRPDHAQAVADLGAWSRAYGEVVFETNVATAYANGRFAMANDPDVKDFVVGLRRTAVLDSDARHNHRAAHGLVARFDDPIWRELGVPAGYRCRCALEPYDIVQAKRDGRLVNGKLPNAVRPAGAYNDPSFTGKSSFGEWSF